jgi:cell division inhibitor SulA
VTCPKCSEAAAHRSHRVGVKDVVLGWLSQIPYRCKKCHIRFYAYRAGEKSDKMRTGEERRIMKIRRAIKWRRSKREIAVYALGLAAFAVVVYWMTQQTTPASGG